MRRTTAALTLLFGLAQPLVAQDPVSVTVDQAYVMAINAVQAGDSKQAIKLLNGLIRARPDDPNLHLLQATAYAQLNRPRPARAAAARAYRLADNPSQKVTAAEFAASSALVQNRPTMTQLWLRRAAQHADDKSQEQIAKDYAHVRRINPFSFTLRGGITPSDNVNSGTDTTDHIINDLRFGDIVSADGEALSGIVTTMDAHLSYRLNQTQTSLTTIGVRLYTRRVSLSSSAKAQLDADAAAVRRRNSDFATDWAEVSLDHLIGLGEKSGNIGLGLSFGSFWYGGSGLFDYSQVRVKRGVPLNDRTFISFFGKVEARESASSNNNDQMRYAIGSTLRRKLENDARFSIGLTLEEADGDSPNVQSSSATIHGSYTFGKQLGPAEVSTSFSLTYTDHPLYSYGSDLIPPGRTDWSGSAGISFFFKDYDYAGFAPKLNIKAGKVSSTSTIFEAEELSISFEIQSKF